MSAPTDPPAGNPDPPPPPAAAPDVAAPLPPSFAVSFFAHVRDNQPKAGAGTWPELVSALASFAKGPRPQDKKDLTAISPAAFRGTRSNENVESVSLLFIDLDGVTEEELTATIVRVQRQGLAVLFYETFSSHEKGAGRFSGRLVVPLSRPVPRDDWGRFWDGAMAFLGVQDADRECRDPSRMYFVPCKHANGFAASAECWEGGALDPTAVPLAPPPALPPVPLASPGAPPSADVLARAFAYLAKLPAAVSGQDGSGALWDAALAMVRGFALPREVALDLLRREYNPRCLGKTGGAEPWSEAELEHKVNDAAKSDRVPLGYLLPKSGPAPTGPIRILGVADIFAPLPPVPWLVQALGLAPGAPTMIAGYGFSAKTMAAQSLAVAIALGKPDVWGFPVSGGPRSVLHLDYEQGERLTRDRYQRLVRGFGATPADLGDRLGFASLPQFYLDNPDAEAILTGLCAGKALLIVDSLRAAAPSVEENSSDARKTLDMLTRVSEATECAVLVLHHARKPSESQSGGAKMAIRGSGAHFDACSSVLVFVGEKGQPTKVSHEKERISGILTDDFSLTVEDVEGNGVRVVRVTPGSGPPREDPLKAAILVELRKGPAAVNALRASLKKGSKVSDEVALLLRDKLVERQGERGPLRLTAAGRQAIGGAIVPAGAA
jgi:hypothetical protein